MEHERHSDRSTEIEDQYAGYEVYDHNGEKIGKVDELFVDDNHRPEYIGVKTGFPGAGSPLIPMRAVRVDVRRRVIEIPLTKCRVGEGPSYYDDQKITPDFEQRVRRYYDGLRDAQEDPGGRGSHADCHGADDEPPSRPSGPTERSTTVGEREAAVDHQEHTTGAAGTEGAGGHESGRGDTLGDTDELRVQRGEEELRVDTREREAGRMNVRKKVRTEREQVRVPKRREEIDIERVPGEGREASEAEIGEEEIVVQVFEEEVVVSKRTVLKEEIRLRKKVVEDEEVVEVDLRKEEVDIEDQTTTRGRGRDADLEHEARRGGR